MWFIKEPLSLCRLQVKGGQCCRPNFLSVGSRTSSGFVRTSQEAKKLSCKSPDRFLRMVESQMREALTGRAMYMPLSAFVSFTLLIVCISGFSTSQQWFFAAFQQPYENCPSWAWAQVTLTQVLFRPRPGNTKTYTAGLCWQSGTRTPLPETVHFYSQATFLG